MSANWSYDEIWELCHPLCAVNKTLISAAYLPGPCAFTCELHILKGSYGQCLSLKAKLSFYKSVCTPALTFVLSVG